MPLRAPHYLVAGCGDTARTTGAPRALPLRELRSNRGPYDLRAARAYLSRPANATVKWDENRAIREIDAAIAEIKRASSDDGKPLADHPPVDAGIRLRLPRTPRRAHG